MQAAQTDQLQVNGVVYCENRITECAAKFCNFFLLKVKLTVIIFVQRKRNFVNVCLNVWHNFDQNKVFTNFLYIQEVVSNQSVASF